MNIKQILTMLTIAFVMSACTQKESAKNQTTTKPTSEKDKYSYALGYDVGNSFIKSLINDSVEVNLDYVMQGIRDGVKESKDSATLLLSKQEIEQAMQTLQESMQAKQEAKMQEKTKKYEERKKTALEDGKKFLEANKKKSGVTVEKSGMQYRVITAGKGAVPKPDDVIKFHIVGKFIDGEEFQSTKTMGTPPEAPLNQINIKGIHEALSKMPIGSVWEVVLPYELAYGEQDTGVIPPKSAVIFELELLEIVKPEAPQSKKK